MLLIAFGLLRFQNFFIKNGFTMRKTHKTILTIKHGKKTCQHFFFDFLKLVKNFYQKIVTNLLWVFMASTLVIPTRKISSEK